MRCVYTCDPSADEIGSGSTGTSMPNGNWPISDQDHQSRSGAGQIRPGKPSPPAPRTRLISQNFVQLDDDDVEMEEDDDDEDDEFDEDP
jgi:hypothetical protein